MGWSHVPLTSQTRGELFGTFCVRVLGSSMSRSDLESDGEHTRDRRRWLLCGLSAAAAAVGVAIATSMWSVVAVLLGGVFVGLGVLVPGPVVALMLAFAPLNKAFGESGGLLSLGLFALVYVGVVIVMILRATTSRAEMPRFVLAAPILAVLAVAAVAVTRAAPLIPNEGDRWTFGLIKPAMYLSMVWIGATAWKGRQSFPFFGVLAGIVLLFAGSVYLQRMGMYEHPFSMLSSSVSEKRMGGLLASANEMGRFLSVYLSLLLPAWSAPLGRRERGLVGCALLLGVPTLVLTLNRGGIVAFGVVLVFWIFGVSGQSVRRKLLSLALVILVVVPVLLVPQVGDYYQTYVRGVDSGDWGFVTQGRDTIWLGVLRYLGDPVTLAVGGGMSDYTYRIREYVDVSRAFATHNTFLRLLVESGLVGLLCVLWVAGSAIRLAFKRLRASPDSAALSQGVILAFAAAAVCGLTGDLGVGSPQMAILWFAVGLLARAPDEGGAK
jgi:O-antigen ligase